MSLGRNYFKRGLSYLKRNGLTYTVIKAFERLDRDAKELEYVPVHADPETLKAQREHIFDHPYKFSILVPVYETDPELFKKMLESVGEQTYGNWELILADASKDSSRKTIVRQFMEEHNAPIKNYGSIFDRVKYLSLNENKGISGNSNEGLKHVTGDYVCLLDHDDVLENTALFDIMTAMDEHEKKARKSESIAKVMAVYTDEDKISEDGTRHFDHHEKRDFDPVLLCSNNYICHFFVADTNLVKSVGGFRSEYDGAQDHDLILRCTEELRRDQVLHIPKVLYHWRSTKASTSENPEAKLYAYDAGKRAVSDHFRRAGINVKVTDSRHLGFFDLEYERLHRSVRSISSETFAGMTEEEVRAVPEEFIMILSATLKPCDADYIADMMSCMHVSSVGAVTGRIIGKNHRVESAGFDIDDTGKPVPRFAGLKRYYSGYLHGSVLHSLSEGFSGDCVLVRKNSVKSFFPNITLKDGFDIYYTPKTEFVRKG